MVGFQNSVTYCVYIAHAFIWLHNNNLANCFCFRFLYACKWAVIKHNLFPLQTQVCKGRPCDSFINKIVGSLVDRAILCKHQLNIEVNVLIFLDR